MFFYYTCSAVAGQQKDVASRNEKHARTPFSLFCPEISATFHPCLFVCFMCVCGGEVINVFITKLFSFDCFFIGTLLSMQSL